MKDKDLKKITEKISEVITNKIQENYQGNKYSLKDVDVEYDYKLSEYDSEVSEKFKKLVTNLLNYSENINIDINSERISISTGDLKVLKYPPKKSNYNTPIDETDYLEIKIAREHSFFINKGYSKRTQYKDTEMYAYFLPIISEKLQEINRDSFNDIWDDIMKESGMMRDNNLDNLLND